MTHKELFESGKVAIKIPTQQAMQAAMNLIAILGIRTSGFVKQIDFIAYPYYIFDTRHSNNYATACNDFYFEQNGKRTILTLEEFLAADPDKVTEKEIKIENETIKIKTESVFVRGVDLPKSLILEIAKNL